MAEPLPDPSPPPVADVRAADRIVFDCIERWFDPVAWQTHLLEQTCGLLGLAVGVCVELDHFCPDQDSAVLSAVEWGWADDAQRRAFFGSRKVGRARPFASTLYQLLRRRFVNQDQLTATRRQLIADSDWQTDPHATDYWQPAGLEHAVISLHHRRDRGTVSLLLLAGGPEPAPGPREVQLLSQIHHSIAVLHRDRLATWSHLSPVGLTARQAEVFQHLITGAAESEIAARLHRSPATVNEHVRAVYRHFGVGSRGKLLAYLLQRDPQANHRAQPPGVLN